MQKELGNATSLRFDYMGEKAIMVVLSPGTVLVPITRIKFTGDPRNFKGIDGRAPIWSYRRCLVGLYKLTMQPLNEMSNFRVPNGVVAQMVTEAGCW